MRMVLPTGSILSRAHCHRATDGRQGRGAAPGSVTLAARQSECGSIWTVAIEPREPLAAPRHHPWKPSLAVEARLTRRRAVVGEAGAHLGKCRNWQTSVT